jgi:hypothetical protein
MKFSYVDTACTAISVGFVEVARAWSAASPTAS